MRVLWAYQIVFNMLMKKYDASNRHVLYTNRGVTAFVYFEVRFFYATALI